MSHDTSLENEQWRDIPNYEGLYQVSNHGNVRRLPTVVETTRGLRPTPGKILKATPNSNGYPKVSLSKNNQQKEAFVHSLVLSSFVRARANEEVACHNDGDPGNNHVENLRWDTVSGNVRDEVRHKTHVESRKTHCPKGHALAGENLDPGQLRRYGKRRCLACSRAHGFIRGRKPYKVLFTKIADAYYSAILDGRKAQIDAVSLLAAAKLAEEQE